MGNTTLDILEDFDFSSDDIGEHPDFSLTRRSFLGAAGASAVTTVAFGADGAEADKRLEFAWATDESSGAQVLDVTIITARRREDGTAHPDSPETIDRVWRLRPESYGPDAALIYRAPSGGRDWAELRIANVSYGRLKSRRQIVFSFRKELVQESGSQKTDRFVVSARTTVWSSRNAPTQIRSFKLEASAPALSYWRRGILLRDFIEPSQALPKLQQQLRTKRVTNTLALMLNGVVRPLREQGILNVSLDREGVWSVVTPPDHKASLAGFGQRVRLHSMHIFWPVNSEVVGEQKEAPLFAEAYVDQDIEKPLEIQMGGRDGPAVQLLRHANADRRPRVIFRSERPLSETGKRRREIRVEAKLDGRWSETIFVDGSGDTVAGPMPDLYGMVLERVTGPMRETDRIYAEDGGTISFQGLYEKKKTENGAAAIPTLPSKAVSMVTPIGPMVCLPLRETDPKADQRRDSFPSRRGWPVVALFSWGPGRRRRLRTEFIEASVAMVEAGVALPNAEYSRLTFAETQVRLYYSRKALERLPIGSYVNLGRRRSGEEFARLDLARATLRASQSHHLLSLTFRFSDIVLSFVDQRVDLARYNTACDLVTRPAETPDDLQPYDTRPTLVVEFPPQHLYEEARFFTTLPPLPDVTTNYQLTVKKADPSVEKRPYDDGEARLYLEDTEEIVLDADNRAHVVDALTSLRRISHSHATKFREELRQLKVDLDLAKGGFEDFAEKVEVKLRELGASKNKLPKEQQVYIGPFALDVDAMRAVRMVYDTMRDSIVEAAIESTFLGIADIRSGFDLAEPKTFEEALEQEIQTQASVPTYALFRNFYREKMIGAALGLEDLKLGANAPKSTNAEDVEFIFAALSNTLSELATSERMARRRKIRAEFPKLLKQQDDLSAPSRGRLANPSRLAFRINCRDGLDAIRHRYPDLDSPSDAEERLPRGEIRFDLQDLIRFRGMELAVTQRAEIVYDPGQLGQISSRQARVADSSVEAMLDRLNFTRGDEVSVATRLAEIAASLSAPSQLETAIELPARMTLSPHQNAVVLTPGPVADIFDLPIDPSCASTTGRSAPPNRLWDARFMTSGDGPDLDPGVRVVHSSDLRPAALLSRFADLAAKSGSGDLTQTQPPGGPLDPWFISRTQSESGGMTAADLESLNFSCPDIDDEEKQRGLPGIVRRLCSQLAARQTSPSLNYQFRNAIDARARHQLVLLSSGWGIPVTGRRDQSLQLTKDSSQVEPSNGLKLWDILPGNAIYEPRPLDVTELSLTALGGTLRHDSSFEPPTAAKFWRDRKSVFDAFTVERWQQWTNLGRDVYTEVVQKGFLFPIGIRASLVQVTERIFFQHAVTKAISAPLRQRMFIRVANPDKTFPALKQPYEGRRFPVQSLKLLTEVTPDIVDPYSDQPDKGEGPAPSGRMTFEGSRGLIFWPRIFKSPLGNIRFEMDVDGAKTDLPMIFVDNAAVDNEATLKAIVDYYNGEKVPSPDTDDQQLKPNADPPPLSAVDPVKHIRTIVFNGVERRYGPENETGSATFQTDHWTLRATGGAKTVTAQGDKSYLIDNGDYFFGSLRQGADQPPFYPAIDTARIHLTQSERLMGRTLGPVRAHFDARYLVHGFPSEQELAETDVSAVKKRNPNEVMLVLRDQWRLIMGNKGDQSGGVFRPAGYLIALSRLKGAMSQADRFKVRAPNTTSDYAHDVASFFKFDADSVVASQKVTGAPTVTGSQSIDSADSSIDDQLKEIRALYEKFFSCDAKLLGLVCLSDLIKFIQRFASPDEGLPELSEKTEFGAAASDGAEATADIVRENVISPLASAARGVRETWDQIEANLDVVEGGTIRIADVFPELDRSLIGLSNALDRAEGETDPLLFSLELSACYSSGQRFLNAVQRASANPGQAIEEALTQRYGDVVTLFRSLDGGIEAWLEQILKEVVGSPDPSVLFEDIAKRLLPDADRLPFKREILLLPRPPGIYISDGAIDVEKLRDFQSDCLNALLPEGDDVEAVIAAFLEFAALKGIYSAKNPPSLPNIDELLKEFLEHKSLIKFSEAKIPVDAEEALELAEEALANIQAAIRDEAPTSELEDEVDRLFTEEIFPFVTDTTRGVFKDVSGALQFNDGNNAEQIRNRYFLCLVLNFAEDPGAYAAKLPIKYHFEFLRFLASLLHGSEELIPQVKVDLSRFFDGLRDILQALADLFSNIQTGNFAAILNQLLKLFDGFGLTLQIEPLALDRPTLIANAFCQYIDPFWDVIQIAMTELADLGEAARLCPDEWIIPTQQMLDGENGLELLNTYGADPSKVDDLPGGNEPSLCKTLLLVAAHAESLRKRVMMGDFRNAVDDILLTASELTLPQDAVEKLARLDQGIDKTRDCLSDIRDQSRTSYFILLTDMEALGSTLRDLNAAAKLEPCSGGSGDPEVFEQLEALANLPRDFKALGERRERLLLSLDAQMKTLIFKLQDIQDAQSDGPWVTVLPIAAATTEHLKDLGLFKKEGNDEKTAWVASDEDLSKAVDNLQEQMDLVATQVAAMIQPIIEALCTVFEMAKSSLDRLKSAEQQLQAKLDEIEGALSSTDTVLQNFLNRARRELDLNMVRAEIADVESRPAFRWAETLQTKLCTPTDPGDVNTLKDLDEFKVGDQEPLIVFSDTPFADIFEKQKIASAEIAKIGNELRPILEQTGRREVVKLLDGPVKRALANGVVIPESPFAEPGAPTSLVSIYTKLVEFRDRLFEHFKSSAFFGPEVAKKLLVLPDAARGKVPGFVPGTSKDKLTGENDQLRGDAKWLEFLAASPDDNGPLSNPEKAAFLSEFVREWQVGEATPIVILEQMALLVEDVLSGQLFRYIDFKALREEFEDQLLSLVPTKVRMGYGFAIHLGNEVQKATAGIFRPGPETALGIDMKIEVDLQPALDGGQPSVDFMSVGTLGPFDVRLVGDFFDALTLRFSSARFETRAGEKPRFDIVYRDYQIGPELKFVEQLQKYLAPKDGSGAIIRFDPSQPGVEAGYRLQLGDFAVGNLAFSNVGLETTAILPFSDDEALFRASLSSRASPFTLTYAPYGGSGFFSILANVDGIIGFEAGFEFGGSGVFAFGPLSGKGRLMSGVYIRQLKLAETRVTEISMTFFVGGSASIWIFHFGAALSVKMGMVDGDMTGEATFSFSFSMGLSDFEYSVQMQKEEQEGFSGQSQSSLHAPEDTQFAAMGGAQKVRQFKNAHGARIISDAKCQSENWNRFRSYFDDTSSPEGYF